MKKTPLSFLFSPLPASAPGPWGASPAPRRPPRLAFRAPPSAGPRPRRGALSGKNKEKFPPSSMSFLPFSQSSRSPSPSLASPPPSAPPPSRTPSLPQPRPRSPRRLRRTASAPWATKAAAPQPLRPAPWLPLSFRSSAAPRRRSPSASRLSGFPAPRLRSGPPRRTRPRARKRRCPTRGRPRRRPRERRVGEEEEKRSSFFLFF